jgi:hypothetical protein
MDDETLQGRVRQLHTQGRSTNAIVRELGVPRARVAPVVRAIAHQRQAAVRLPPLVGCWVNRGWSAGLAVPPDRDWPDRVAHESDTEGLAAVLVAREHPRIGDDVTVCGYLVDPYCLGVKNALGPRAMGRKQLHRFVAAFFDGFDGAPLEAPAELARHLVWGAVAYARGLGFEPHPTSARPPATSASSRARARSVSGATGCPTTSRALTTTPTGSFARWMPTSAWTTSTSSCRHRSADVSTSWAG